MTFKQKYKSLSNKDKIGEEKKITISDEVFCIAELLEEIKINLERLKWQKP